MKHILLVSFFLALSSFSVFAKNDSMLKLDSIAHILIDNIDHNQNNCKLSIEESKSTLNALHAQIDIHLKKLNVLKEMKSWEKSCQIGCHCDLFLGVMENDLSNEEVKTIYNKIKDKNNKLTEKEKTQCTKKAIVLCNSKTMKNLIKDSKNFHVAPGI